MERWGVGLGEGVGVWLKVEGVLWERGLTGMGRIESKEGSGFGLGEGV